MGRSVAQRRRSHTGDGRSELDNAGLKANECGFIDTDEYCRTKAATIFAVGDVTGKTQLAHFATAQGMTAAENALGQRPRRHSTLVPDVIFTSPEVATVGLSEAGAAAENRVVKTGKFRFSGLGKALAAGETTGFVKWIADATSDQLLGAAAVGPHATELIAAAATAIRAELTAREPAKRSMPIRHSLKRGWKPPMRSTANASMLRPDGAKRRRERTLVPMARSGPGLWPTGATGRSPAFAPRSKRARACASAVRNCPRPCEKKFRWRRPRHTLKGRQTESEVERVGLRLQLRKQQAEAGDTVLLYGDESEALTHPYLARAWAKSGADLRVPAPGQAKKVAMLGSLDHVTRQLIVHTSPTKRSSDFIAHLEQLDRLFAPQPGRQAKPVVLVEDNGAAIVMRCRS